MPEPAIVVLTPGGLELGRRLAQGLGRGEVILARGELRQTLAELFRAGRPLVCVMALGIVVRTLGPLVHDKRTDPAVVVLDEAGRFAVSVLGGHAADANALARETASVLGATPVITTASESLGLPAVDQIGRDRGWKIEPASRLTEVAAAVVRGEPVAVYQEAGAPDWWQEFGDWPASFQRVAECPRDGWAAILLISDRCRPWPQAPAVVYRPPTLVLGVGCRRGVPCAEIEETFQHVCRVQGLAPLSLREVATVSLKADEPGLREFADRHGVSLRIFGVDELAAVPGLPTPSETVRAKIGSAGVAEPAALLAAQATELLMPKHRAARVTMALARKDDA